MGPFFDGEMGCEGARGAFKKTAKGRCCRLIFECREGRKAQASLG